MKDTTPALELVGRESRYVWKVLRKSTRCHKSTGEES